MTIRRADVAPFAGDRGDIVLGWLSRVVVVLALLGIVAFDALSVGIARVSAEDDAGAAARAASEAWRERADVQQAYEAAVAVATEHGEQIAPDDFRIEADGTVHLTVTRTATTLVLYRVGPLAKYADISAAGTAQYQAL